MQLLSFHLYLYYLKTKKNVLSIIWPLFSCTDMVWIPVEISPNKRGADFNCILDQNHAKLWLPRLFASTIPPLYHTGPSSVRMEQHMWISVLPLGRRKKFGSAFHLLENPLTFTQYLMHRKTSRISHFKASNFIQDACTNKYVLVCTCTELNWLIEPKYIQVMSLVFPPKSFNSILLKFMDTWILKLTAGKNSSPN